MLASYGAHCRRAECDLGNEEMTAEVQIKCVYCKHKEWIRLGRRAAGLPMCSKCMGPTVVIGSRTT